MWRLWGLLLRAGMGTGAAQDGDAGGRGWQAVVPALTPSGWEQSFTLAPPLFKTGFLET